MGRFIKIAAIVLVVCIAAIISFNIYKGISTEETQITLEGSNYTVILKYPDGSEKEISSSQKLNLKSGDYIYYIKGDGINTKPRSLKISDSSEVKISPVYLNSYMSNILEKERPKILNSIYNKYPNVSNIEITSLNIKNDVKWAYGTLIVNGDKTDIYRFALKNDSNNWELSGTPSIAMNKKTHPEIPEDIVKELYKN